jgi:hypothetical protein
MLADQSIVAEECSIVLKVWSFLTTFDAGKIDRCSVGSIVLWEETLKPQKGFSCNPSNMFQGLNILPNTILSTNMASKQEPITKVQTFQPKIQHFIQKQKTSIKTTPNHKDLQANTLKNNIYKAR